LAIAQALHPSCELRVASNLHILDFLLLLWLENCLLLLLLLKVILLHPFPAFGLIACQIVPWGPRIVGWIPGIVRCIMVHWYGV
jgi:hypothetical protein